MFKTRLLSGIVLVILAIGLIYFGNNILLCSTFLISCVGMFELYRIFKIEKKPLAFIGYFSALLYYINLKFNIMPDIMLLFMGTLIIIMFIYVFSYPEYDAKQVAITLFGIFYVAIMLSYVYQIRCLNKGLYLAYLVFLCSWGCDTCAYCVGMICSKTVGTHKMSPKLSPKKSIEGAVGGVIGAALLTIIYCFVFKSKMNIEIREIIILSAIAAIAGLISMIGDLTASAIKRNYDIKDYGHLIPGHGGILDRFDSMIITAPIIYYLAYYFM